MKRLLFMIFVLIAAQSQAQQLVAIGDRFFVASPGTAKMISRDGTPFWTGEGVRSPTATIVGASRVAVLDALRNEAAVFDLASGTRTLVRTAETPIGGYFTGNDLVVVARDSRSIDRIGVDGSRTAQQLGLDPAFVRIAGSTAVVYSRGDGRLQLFDASSLRPLRETRVATFASDLEIDATTAYLTYPREATVRQIDLATLRAAGDLRVGAVPVDLTFASGNSALNARSLAIADPSARRIWLLEGRQSITQAFARGFIRGLLGFGLTSNRAREFPSGVDRVFSHGGRLIAYDTSTGTIYRVTRQGVSVVARAIAPHAFTVTASGVAWLDDGTLRIE